jgi:hypothetical protein
LRHDDSEVIRTRHRLAALTMAFGLLGACIPAPGGEATGSPAPSVGPPAASAPKPTPSGPTPPPSFVRPTPTPLPTFLSYEVKSGDTLTSIAKAHGTTPRSIAFWNRTTHPSLDPDSPDYEPDRLKIGWVLRLIPGIEIDEDETFPE